MGFWLAAAFATVSGGVPTIQKQFNVASIVRNATGQFTVNFASALSSANYGVLLGTRLPDNSGGDKPHLCAPARNSNTHNAYSTTALDILCTAPSLTAADPAELSILVFDPSQTQPNVSAAAFWTLSGSSITLQAAANISSVSYISTGLYQPNFSPALSSSNYSAFSGSRYPNFTNDASSVSAQWNQSPNNLHTTSAFSQGNILGGSGAFEMGNAGILAIMADAVPSGVLAAVRFSVSGSACTIVKQTNVASVTYQTVGCYRVNFSSSLPDANYGVICGGIVGAATTATALVGPNAYTTPPRNAYSQTALDLVTQSADSVGTGGVEAVNVDVIVFDPTQLTTPLPTMLGQAWF